MEQQTIVKKKGGGEVIISGKGVCKNCVLVFVIQVSKAKAMA